MGARAAARRAARATSKAPPADAFTFPIEHRMRRLVERMADVEERTIETQRSIQTEHTLRPMLLDIYAAECGRLEELRDDAVRILTLLVEKGLVSQEELNRAVGGG